MNWDHFIYFALPAIVLWGGGAILAQFKSIHKIWSNICVIMGLLVFTCFIALMWIALERPPLRTMGETRLWYSFLIMCVGYFIYLKYKFAPLLLYSAMMASVFTIINIARPEIFDQTLMPALQNAWFIPHVTIYMLAYGVMGVVFLSVCYISIKPKYNSEITPMIHELVNCGVGLLMIGMMTGALWAKEAWGDFWGWDAKESWALITVMIYLIYIHYYGERKITQKRDKLTLIVGFIALQICWYGVKYLPTAAASVHTYSN